MAIPATIEAVQLDLFTPKDELEERYTPLMVARIIRIREAYTWMLANPEAKDRQIVELIMTRKTSVSKSSSYSDLSILKQLLPMLSKNSRDFHRWRFSEMIMETYSMAKRHKDFKTMERAATSYGKLHRVDLEDEMQMPYDQILVQPFVATMDPTVLGLKPIPDIYRKMDKLAKELMKDCADIEDVEYEEADIDESLFSELPTEENDEA